MNQKVEHVDTLGNFQTKSINFSDFFSVAEVTTNSTNSVLRVNEIFYTVYTEGVQEAHILSPILEISLSSFGVVSNLFVLIIILTVPALATVKTTTFVLSLSISDLMVSGIVMVFSSLINMKPPLINVVHGDDTVCYVWASVSMAACTASSLNVCVMSIDRYFFVTYPLHYDLYISRCRINALVCAVWSISLATALTTLTIVSDSDVHLHIHTPHGWIDIASNETIMATNSSFMDFVTHCHELPSKYSVIAIVVVVVILPCVVVIVVYVQIFRLVIKQFRIIRKEKAQADRLRDSEMRTHQSRKFLEALVRQLAYQITKAEEENSTKQTPRVGEQSTPNASDSNRDKGNAPKKREELTSGAFKYFARLQRYKSTNQSVSTLQLSKYYTSDHNKSSLITNSPHTITSGRRSGSIGRESINANRRTSLTGAESNVERIFSDTTYLPLNPFPSRVGVGRESSSNISAMFSNFTHRVSITNRHELKAALVLVVIAGTYVVCWLPFGVVSIIMTVDDDLVSANIRELLLWLAYSNSCWNPLIYALLNKNFRLSVRMLLIKCLGRKNSFRRELYLADAPSYNERNSTPQSHNTGRRFARPAIFKVDTAL